MEASRKDLVWETTRMYQPTLNATTLTLLAPAEPAAGSHIIVLTCAHSGAERLGNLLAEDSTVVCTTGSGVIPLCAQAASTWRTAEDSGGALSTLAAASVRAMAGSVISVIKSRAGRQRWCEISTAPAVSVRTFLQLYPETKIVCFYRDCAGFVGSALRSHPCTLGGPAFAAFAAAHPGNPAATAAAYWHACTGPILSLERDEPGRCQRVRYEDLAGGQAEAERVRTFLGLRQETGGVHRRLGSPVGTGSVAVRPSSPDATVVADAADAADAVDRIPLTLLGQVNRLQGMLGYPPVGHPRGQ
ncbi:MAG TPA: sulfotransferase [Streptosporangiaceae bacterium]